MTPYSIRAELRDIRDRSRVLTVTGLDAELIHLKRLQREVDRLPAALQGIAAEVDLARSQLLALQTERARLERRRVLVEQRRLRSQI